MFMRERGHDPTPTIDTAGRPSSTARNDAITVLGISVRGKDHFTRLWPTAKEEDP